MTTASEKYIKDLDALRMQLASVQQVGNVVLFSTGFSLDKGYDTDHMIKQYGPARAAFAIETINAARAAQKREVVRLERAIDQYIKNGIKEPLSEEEYVKTGACPSCHNPDGPGIKDGSRLEYLDSSFAAQEMQCSKCDAQWQEQLSVTGYYMEDA